MDYRRKRDFSRTLEPRGGPAPVAEKLTFVVQKHAASRLHFDFRLLLGERLQGSFALVRTRRGAPKRPEWLLIKHRDAYAEPDSDVVADNDTSVATGRTMEEIATT